MRIKYGSIHVDIVSIKLISTLLSHMPKIEQQSKHVCTFFDDHCI